MGGEDVERRSRTGWREFAGTFRLAGWCEVRAGLGCKRMERVRGEGEANVIALESTTQLTSAAFSVPS